MGALRSARNRWYRCDFAPQCCIFAKHGITFAVNSSNIPTFRMSRPKNFLIPFVAHVYRIDTIDKVLYGWVERAKICNPDISDNKAIQEFLDHYNLNDEWDVPWAAGCLQRLRGLVRESKGKL